MYTYRLPQFGKLPRSPKPLPSCTPCFKRTPETLLRKVLCSERHCVLLRTTPQWHLRSSLLSFLYARVVNLTSVLNSLFPRTTNKLPVGVRRPGTALWRCLGTALSPVAWWQEKVGCHFCPLRCRSCASSFSFLPSPFFSSLIQLL